MNTELMGMSNEELIQWAARNGRNTERGWRNMFDCIQVYCATYPVSLSDFVECAVILTTAGLSLSEAVNCIREVGICE